MGLGLYSNAWDQLLQSSTVMLYLHARSYPVISPARASIAKDRAEQGWALVCPWQPAAHEAAHTF